MRESAFVKGRRMLTEGRLVVRAVSERHLSARCRGDSGEIYVLAADAQGYSCSCPALSTACSHLIALKLCTLKPLPIGTGPNGPERNHR